MLIIGLFDLLSTIKISLTEPAWIGFGVEAYVFASLVYFAFCYAMSRYSRSFEHEAPMIEMVKVNKWFGAVPGAEGRRPRGRARREGGGVRAVGLGQVDADPPSQPAGGRTRAAGSSSTASSSTTT